MARAMYALLTPTSFRLPIDPGPLAIYYLTPTPIVNDLEVPVLDSSVQPMFNVPPTIDRATQATIDSRFSRACNYWLSYMNTQRAVYNLLDGNMYDTCKVSIKPALVRWNLTMEVREIFDQITSTYGRPTPAALFWNDMLFRRVYSPQDAPEVLLWHIEDCQEVQILGDDPYTVQQLINNAVCLLLQCGLYTRDFEDWDRKTAANKIWTNLKTFVQECYTSHLNATSITVDSQGYVQNTFAALGEESDDDDDDVQTVTTQMAVLTTQSQLTGKNNG